MFPFLLPLIPTLEEREALFVFPDWELSGRRRERAQGKIEQWTKTKQLIFNVLSNDNMKIAQIKLLFSRAHKRG